MQTKNLTTVEFLLEYTCVGVGGGVKACAKHDKKESVLRAPKNSKQLPEVINLVKVKRKNRGL